ncbi:MAG: hypothetical protein K0R64_3466 [Novosphingobium lindaniclasticum]|jgi:hypothetical protein|uniref:hypothetical protein n=1 Tax=Novosphingobium lindaniclasticum TaxID=1329895 RepID=UPI00240A7250|nr:hypothetical protein [Novosphingobium lindaniclasticum]MDF2640482.1 hypothetical protein [Novosphingobium lindaniclasticum]
MNALPLVLFWTLVICAIASRPPFALYLFFATMPFGACAAIPTGVTGGLTLVATPIVALVVVGKAFLNRSGPASFLTLALLPDRLLCLFAFWIVVSVTTLFMPRIFAGEILVVPVRGILSTPAPLFPSTQNLSQWVYMTISVFTVFAMARLLQTAAMRQHALQAMCLGAAMLIFTGLVDFASQYVPLGALLAPFRTASYALATEVEVLGSKRVVGLMPEASAFGNYCLGFLCALHFYRRAIVDPVVKERVCPVLLALLVILCWQSKSSATYVGLVLFFGMAALEWLLRANAEGRGTTIYKQGLLGELSVLVAVLAGVTLTLLFKPDLLDPGLAMIDRMVLQKTSSLSYEERGMWHFIALSSVFESYGIGIGLGSTRSSSSIVAILSASGILGGLLFYAFAAQSFSRVPRYPTIESRIINSAFRFSYPPMIAVSLMIADANFEPLTGFGFGITAALSIALKQKPGAPIMARTRAPAETPAMHDRGNEASPLPADRQPAPSS